MMFHEAPPGETTLVRIVASHFVAGLEASDGRVVRTAPILRRRMAGLTGREVATICKRQGWTWEVIDP